MSFASYFIYNYANARSQSIELPVSHILSYFYFLFMFTRVKVLECSAKDDYNIMEIFRTFVTLSRILPVNGSAESGSGLKRRSSAYVSASSKGRCGQHRSTVYTARRLFIMSSPPSLWQDSHYVHSFMQRTKRRAGHSLINHLMYLFSCALFFLCWFPFARCMVCDAQQSPESAVRP